MPQQERIREPQGGGAAGTTVSRPMCKCCTPPKPLVLRPEFGLMADGSARYAICIARRPPVVHVNRGDGEYERRDDLTLSGDGNRIMGPDGNPVATSAQSRRAQEEWGHVPAIGGRTPSSRTGERIDLTRDPHYWR